MQSVEESNEIKFILCKVTQFILNDLNLHILYVLHIGHNLIHQLYSTSYLNNFLHSAFFMFLSEICKAKYFNDFS